MSTKLNPYPAQHSAYHHPTAAGGIDAAPRTAHLHHIMKATIESQAFPCYGAKAAVRNKTYGFALYNDMNHANTLGGLCHDLCAFSREQKTMAGDYTTFITCFDQTPLRDIHDFEDKVWKLLGGLASQDSAHHAWDPVASPDPEDSTFSFSFGGTAYFVIALSPVSARMSRQFVVPTLVFNALYQFQELRHKGLFELLKQKIRHNEAVLENGAPHPLLSDFGTPGGTIQYVGAPAKDGAWKCPFHKYFKPSTYTIR